MSLNWRRCLLCNGMGELSIRKTRIQTFLKIINNTQPILDDELKTCPLCDGKGSVPIKSFPFKPWRKDN